MALESELKYLQVDLVDLSRRLKQTDALCLGRYFESNLVFDTRNRALKQAGILLRLREKQGQAVLTVKHPPEKPVPSALKVFEEIETNVGDFSTMKKLLEIIGFSVAFAYEKIREKWKYLDCSVCLDHLPFGDYVELEGTEISVLACAAAMGLAEAQTSTATYHALNIEYRALHGLEPEESFVFSDDEKRAILDEFGKDSIRPSTGDQKEFILVSNETKITVGD